MSDPPLDPSFRYRYARRQLPYRTEKLEISPEEYDEIQGLLSHINDQRTQEDLVVARLRELGLHRPVKVIVDTDIGTDIDDVLALLMLLHLPASDVDLLGPSIFDFREL